jgi:preprotein translocase subunit SecD
LKRGNTPLLIFILIIFACCLWFIWPGHGVFGRNDFKLGLDLKGGSHLVYSIDLSKKDPAQTDADVIEGVKNKIERRVNAYGVTEPVVQTIRNERGTFVLVQLPGVKDINEAMNLIGQTAELDFRELVVDENGKPALDEQGNEQWVISKAKGSDGSRMHR